VAGRAAILFRCAGRRVGVDVDGGGSIVLRLAHGQPRAALSQAVEDILWVVFCYGLVCLVNAPLGR
jgi:hypothetical protein